MPTKSAAFANNVFRRAAFDQTRTGSTRSETTRGPTMKSQHLRFKNDFHVSIGNRRSQAAEMVLSPGETQGGPGNRHRGSDQWLFIIDGTGTAIVDGIRYRLRAGTIV